VRKGNRKTVMGIVTMQMLMMDREKKKEEKNKKQNSPERKRGGGGKSNTKTPWPTSSVSSPCHPVPFLPT